MTNEPVIGESWRAVCRTIARQHQQERACALNPFFGRDWHRSQRFLVSAYRRFERVLNHSPTAADVESFLLEHLHLLSDRKHVFWSWQDQGCHFMTISIMETDLETAILVARVVGQNFVWDLNQGRRIRVRSAGEAPVPNR